MEYIMTFLAALCAIIGIIGAIVPALPGPPLSFVGVLLLLLCDGNDISTGTVIATGVAAALITILDYIAPVWLTKKKGGTKYGMWGAGIGMFAGLFMGPWGIIAGPFIGAFIGELLARTPTDKALRMAFVSFAAFMLTTGVKVVYCLVLLAIIATNGWKILWG